MCAAFFAQVLNFMYYGLVPEVKLVCLNPY